MLAARAEGRVVGVAVLAYRPSVSADGLFASIEDLHVEPDARRGASVGHCSRLWESRCAARNVSYVEALVEDEEAAAFYAASGYEERARRASVLSRSLVLFRTGEA